MEERIREIFNPDCPDLSDGVQCDYCEGQIQAILTAVAESENSIRVDELKRLLKYDLNPCSDHDHCECQIDSKDMKPELPSGYFTKRLNALKSNMRKFENENYQ